MTFINDMDGSQRMSDEENLFTSDISLSQDEKNNNTTNIIQNKECNKNEDEKKLQNLKHIFLPLSLHKRLLIIVEKALNIFAMKMFLIFAGA